MLITAGLLGLLLAVFEKPFSQAEEENLKYSKRIREEKVVCAAADFFEECLKHSELEAGRFQDWLGPERNYPTRIISQVRREGHKQALAALQRSMARMATVMLVIKNEPSVSNLPVNERYMKFHNYDLGGYYVTQGDKIAASMIDPYQKAVDEIEKLKDQKRVVQFAVPVSTSSEWGSFCRSLQLNFANSD